MTKNSTVVILLGIIQSISTGIIATLSNFDSSEPYARVATALSLFISGIAIPLLCVTWLAHTIATQDKKLKKIKVLKLKLSSPDAEILLEYMRKFDRKFEKLGDCDHGARILSLWDDLDQIKLISMDMDPALSEYAREFIHIRGRQLNVSMGTPIHKLS
jgi:hypothetical protein